MDSHIFDDIRPFERGEMKFALNELLRDRHFNKMIGGFLPLPKVVRNALFKLLFVGIKTPLDFQVRFMKPIVRHILRKHANKASFEHDAICSKGNYSFISNHRDIVLDSAILSYLLHKSGFATTCEIAIGDNLLIYPWIKTLVRMNKAFIVRRSLKAKEMLESSRLMSSYIHYAVTQKKENLWIAQREGRAKDSSDQTQDSVLKMLAMGAELPPVESLRELNITPLTISYEYDPCDYLKAQEFQQRRDDASWKKSKQDDLDNMRIGIFGYKGHVHYHCASCINEWIDELAELPKQEFYRVLAERITAEIHRGYMLYPCNFIAYDELNGTKHFADRYSAADVKKFDEYLNGQIAKVSVANPDVPFLRGRILTMYANPVENKLKSCGKV